MRVLHVAEVSHGGVISLVGTYARDQVDRGHDVHVLVPPDAPALPGTRHDWTPARRSLPSLLRARRRLQEVVTEAGPDVVHLHSFFPGLLGRLRPLHGAGAVVYQPHSFAFRAVPARASGVVSALERRAARHTDRMITNCLDERDEGRRHGVEVPTTVVGLPVDTARFAPPETDTAALRAELGVTARHLVVCVGRLSRQKGQQRLAAAWEAVDPDDAQLVLVGPGDPAEVAAAAPRCFGSSILAVGACDDVRPWLWAASVAVQPSLYEGQSVAMAEALSCGLPLVMTDVNGAREAIAPPGEPAAGAVVAVDDLAGLMAQLDRRRRHPEQLVSEAAAARDRALRLFSAQQVMSRLDRAYSEALTSAASATRTKTKTKTRIRRAE